MRRAKVQAPTCVSCDAVIEGTPPFCDICGRPTPFATYEDQTAWEVAQWRAYNDRENGSGSETATTMRVHASEAGGGTRSTASAVIDRLEMRSEDDVAPWQQRLAQRETMRAEREAQATRTAPETNEVSHQPAPPPVEPQVAEPTSVDTVSMPDAEAVADTEPVHPRRTTFVSRFRRGNQLDRPATYRRCLECGGDDWVLRAGGADDETYRYWCLRCGSAFHTDLRLRHAFKPWVISAAVIVAVVLGIAHFV